MNGTHCLPLVTGLLKGKTTEIYENFWKIVKNEIGEYINLRQANFDFEPAAIKTFANEFPWVLKKNFQNY